MILYEKENNGFVTVIKFVNRHWNENTISNLIFRFVYNNKILYAKYDTMYETDNGLELDDKDYEEYNAIVFENIETHELFEVNYANLPQELYCGDERIL